MSKIKRGHYVPQSYLERFTNPSGKFYAFDKSEQQKFETYPTNLAVKSYFYDTSQNMASALISGIQEQVANLGEKEFLEHIVKHQADPLARQYMIDNIQNSHAPIEEMLGQAADVQYLEKLLSQYEYEANRLIDQVILEVKNNGIFDERHKSNLAFMAVIQYIRTRGFREHLVRRNKIQRQSEPQRDHYIKETERQLHLAYLLDPDLLFFSARIVNDYSCLIGINDAAIPTYTSDDPVVWWSGQKEVGILKRPQIILFPLDPKHLLLFFEESQYPEYAANDRKAVSLISDNMISYNHMEVLNSYRQIYCQQDDFALARKICNSKSSPSSGLRVSQPDARSIGQQNLVLNPQKTSAN